MKPTRRLALLAPIFCTFSAPLAQAAPGTWAVDADGTWATTTNWAGGIVASGSAATDIANFTNDITADRTVTLGAAQTIGNIVFSDSGAAGSAWTITGNTLTLGDNVAGGTTSTITTDTNATIRSIIAGADGLIKAGAGTLTLTGVNTYTGNTTLNASSGTLEIAGAGSLGSGAYSSNIAIGAGSTLKFASSANQSLTGVISGTGNLTKEGTGTLTIQRGNPGNSFSGTLTVNEGTVDLRQGTNSQPALGVAALVLGGGTLKQTRVAAVTGATSFSSTTLNAGSSTIFADALSTGNTTGFNINNINRNVGGTLLISYGGSGSIVNTTAINTNGILGGYATFGTDTWAVGSAAGVNTAITGLASYTLNGTLTSATNNIDIQAATVNATGSAANSLRFSTVGAKTLNLSGATTLTTGGILVASTVGANATLITGGTSLAGAANKDLIVIQNNNNASGALTIASDIINNGGATGLTKSGAGELILSGTNNSYTGITTVNTGTLSLSGGSAIANTGAVSLANVSGAILKLNSSETIGSLAGGGANGGNVNLQGNTLTAGDANNTTYAGVISGTGGYTKTGSGTQTLSGANTYSGATAIDNGTLSANKLDTVGGNSSLGNATSSVTLGSAGAQGTLSYTGNTATYTRGFTVGNGGGRLNVASSGQTLTVGTNDVTGSGLFSVGGAGNTTITSNLTHTGGLTKAGGGVLTLSGASNSYAGTTTVQEGTLTLGLNAAISNTLILGVSGSTVGSLDVTAKASFSQASVSGSGTLNIGAGKTINVTTALGPGFSPGAVNVTGNLALESTTTTTMELAGNGGNLGVDSDYVNVSGSLTVDGLLAIVGYNSYDTTQNATYNLFDATSITGDFDSVTVASNALTLAGDVWSGTFSGKTYSFSENTGVLTVVPEPAAALLGGLGLLALLRRRRN